MSEVDQTKYFFLHIQYDKIKLGVSKSNTHIHTCIKILKDLEKFNIIKITLSTNIKINI